jgi:hypothetical protein
MRGLQLFRSFVLLDPDFLLRTQATAAHAWVAHLSSGARECHLCRMLKVTWILW